jgi:hypothetical protein
VNNFNVIFITGMIEKGTQWGSNISNFLFVKRPFPSIDDFLISKKSGNGL